jgi:transposase
MTHYVGLDVSQKLTAICVVDNTGRRLWRGQCNSDPEQIERVVRRHAGDDARIGIETGPMTPWLVHELRGRGLDVTCLDARHARAALKMQINKTDQNDAEGLAQIMRTGAAGPKVPPAQQVERPAEVGTGLCTSSCLTPTGRVPCSVHEPSSSA